jgi:hypothetical protein
MVAVEHGHDQAEGLGGAEHQGREPQAAADAVAAEGTTDGLDRDAGLAEDADVPPDRPLRDAQLVGEPVRGDARAALEQFQRQQRPCRGARVELHKIPRNPEAERPEPNLACPDMTENVLDTTIAEPSMTAGEVDMLLFALERSRAQFAWKCGGLDAAGLSRRHPPSTMTLGQLLKHLAYVEDDYIAVHVTGQPLGAPWDAVHAGWDYAWRTADDDTPDELYALWRGAVERSRAAVAKALAEGGLDQPSKLTISTGESPNLRRVLVDLHDEYARHVGHADLLREAVDGLVGEDPPQPREPAGSG